MTESEILLRARAEVAASRDAALTPAFDVWEALVQGQFRVEDTFCSERGCYLLLLGSPRHRPLKPPQRAILERILGGNCQKRVAMEFAVSNSTVATVAKNALGVLGVDCQPSRAPLALVLLAQASREGSRHTLTAELASFEHAGRVLRVVRMSRPDGALDTVLPPAETEVLRARLEGRGHKAIADARRTSQRTIANQLASASRRLGASGRLEIISRLVAISSACQAAALAS